MASALKRIGWRRLRTATQLLFLLLFLLPLTGLSWFQGTYVTSRLLGVQLTDPYGALQVLVAHGLVGSLGVLAGALLVLLLYLLLGRAFCSWVCPLGSLLEWIDRLRPVRLVRRWRLPEWSRWALALLLLGGGAATGIALFEWLSPQATLMRSLLFGAGAELLLLAFVLGLDLFILRRGWCRSLCPAGAAYSLLGRFALLRVGHDRAACNRCGRCIQACPMDGRLTLLETVSGQGPASANPWSCSNCGLCVERCTEGALSFTPAWRITKGAEGRNGSLGAAPTSLDRRQALLLMGGAVAVASLGFARPLAAAPRERTLLRPPGAAAESSFLALCLRCGQCLQACPRQALHLGNLQDGLSLGTPYLIPRINGCDLCGECVPVCPTGALWLAPNQPVQMGTAVIDQERCLTYNGDVCRSCFVACPLQGEAIFLEGALRPTVDPGRCAGCGLCEQHCIMEPPAIIIQPMNPTT